jgi:hypothetical protein
MVTTGCAGGYQVSPRLQSIEILALPAELRVLFWEQGLDTVEDLLRWKSENRRASTITRDQLERIDDSLAAVGLFGASPISPRNWEIYYKRVRGASFSSLSKVYSLSPAAVRVIYYKVEDTLAYERKTREMFGSGLSTRVQDLPLPTRAKFGLQRANVLTLASLLRTPPEAILKMRGLGATSLQAIRDLQTQFSQ